MLTGAADRQGSSSSGRQTRCRWLLIGLACVASACGSAATTASDPTSSGTVPGPSVTTVPSVELASDERGVAVTVSGVLEADGGICPAEHPGCPFAIATEGDRGDVAAGDFVVGQGWSDGARLLLATAMSRFEPPSTSTPSFDSLCPGMTNPAGVDTSRVLEIANPIVGSTDQNSDALAAAWIDQQTNVVTLWFARDLDRYRDQLEQAFGDVNVCLADGARFSEQELRDASSRIAELVSLGSFVVQGGYGSESLSNRLVVPIEALDPAGRAALDALEPVVAVPFIELLDRPLADLPVWRSPVEGTVDLITDASRTNGGMAALGRFVLRYDQQSNCIYWETDDQRGTLVWPFGYTAAELDGVVTVFDARGDRVVGVGEQVELGGGFVGNEPLLMPVIGENRCGANEVFVVSS